MQLRSLVKSVPEFILEPYPVGQELLVTIVLFSPHSKWQRRRIHDICTSKISTKSTIYITELTTLSALGSTTNAVWDSYKTGTSLFNLEEVDNRLTYLGKLQETDRKAIETLKLSNKRYADLDDSVLFAIYCGQKLEKLETTNCGINIGSSRGATGLFEKYHQEFLETGLASTLSSPTTTLGNISSWVAQDLQSKGPTFSHSITCSTAFHALLNGIAWLESGLAESFIVGGSEAPLTPFTIAQMRAMKIYAQASSVEDKTFPNQSLNLQKTKNSMILGEGAGLAMLQKNPSKESLAKIIGIGYATESLTHGASISKKANCLQDSMRMALKNHNSNDVDVVVCHAPGTLKGDQAEVNAIHEIFGKHEPALTSNKWQIGHTFGASGLLSLELAVLMLRHQEFIGIPYLENQILPDKIDTILINTVGFGGNAVSVLVSG